MIIVNKEKCHKIKMKRSDNENKLRNFSKSTGTFTANKINGNGNLQNNIIIYTFRNYGKFYQSVFP